MLGTNTITNVLCILLFTLSIPSLAAITDVFNVATGKVPGSCDAFSDILDDDFQQALAMGRSGALAIQRALKGKLSFQGKRMLWMMYGILIEEDTAELSRGVRTKLATIGGEHVPTFLASGITRSSCVHSDQRYGGSDKLQRQFLL